MSGEKSVLNSELHLAKAPESRPGPNLIIKPGLLAAHRHPALGLQTLNEKEKND